MLTVAKFNESFKSSHGSKGDILRATWAPERQDATHLGLPDKATKALVALAAMPGETRSVSEILCDLIADSSAESHERAIAFLGAKPDLYHRKPQPREIEKALLLGMIRLKHGFLRREKDFELSLSAHALKCHTLVRTGFGLEIEAMGYASFIARQFLLRGYRVVVLDDGSDQVLTSAARYSFAEAFEKCQWYEGAQGAESLARHLLKTSVLEPGKEVAYASAMDAVEVCRIAIAQHYGGTADIARTLFLTVGHRTADGISSCSIASQARGLGCPIFAFIQDSYGIRNTGNFANTIDIRGAQSAAEATQYWFSRIHWQPTNSVRFNPLAR